MTDKPPSSALHAQAVDWAVRVGDPAFGDWEAFAQWMSASPDHAAAYHAAEAATADMVEILSAAPRPAAAPLAPLPPIAEPHRPRRAPWRWAGGAIAAAVVALIGYHQIPTPTEPMRAYETAPGVQRVVALADGSTVRLNGDSRLLVGSKGRTARLERGEGLFTVRHDAGHPFRVAVGGAEIVDVGTVFDVVREPAGTRVAVSEGAIDWTAARHAVRVDAGRGLRADDGADTVVLTRVSQAAVGDWSRGELAFDGTPLGRASADLARTIGTTIEVAPGLAERPVRATIHVESGADATVRRFARLLGLKSTRIGQGWRLTAPS